MGKDERSGICNGFMLYREMCDKCNEENRRKYYCGKALYDMLVKFYKDHENNIEQVREN